MSIFICAACGAYADADDGCVDRSDRVPPYVQRLVCIECADEASVMYDEAEPINLHGEEVTSCPTR